MTKEQAKEELKKLCGCPTFIGVEQADEIVSALGFNPRDYYGDKDASVELGRVLQCLLIDAMLP